MSAGGDAVGNQDLRIVKVISSNSLNVMKPEEEFSVQRYSVPELADHYKTTPRNFRRWLKELRPRLGKRRGHLFSSAQVKLIVDHLGAPFVAMFGLFVNYSEAFGQENMVHYSSPGSNRDQDEHGSDPHDTDASGHASTDNHHTDTTGSHTDVGGFDGSSNLQAGSTLFIILLGQLSLMNNLDPRRSARLRIVNWVLQITILSVSVAYFGYWVGKIIF